MSDEGLRQARDKMTAEGVDPVAIEVFSHYYRLLESGETGMVPEDTIEPLDMEALADADVPAEVAADAIGKTVVIKLNGGLGTSMGMDRAKSLLQVRDGLSFLDVIARQVLAVREEYGVRLPLVMMNSFRTREDTLAALAAYDGLAASELPLDFLQNKEPKLLADGLTPATWESDPSLEWCPPGHGDIYTALRGTGLLDAMLEAGYTQVFVSNSDNLGAVPDARVAGWFAGSGAPFAIEAVRRTPSDRKGGHFAKRLSDGRIVLRETAQTLPEDAAALGDLSRHGFASTNNLWFDLRAMKEELDRRDGILGLAMIKNTKTLDPADPDSPEVVQIETAMGAAIEVFDGARTIEVGRDRFVPVKTTNDLLVLRSDCYRLDEVAVLHQVPDEVPFVDLDSAYKHVTGFEQRFPDGPPSLKEATSLVVHGDWTFGAEVTVVGDVVVGEKGSAGEVEAGARLGGPRSDGQR
jgi:UTP--glucose-1-phosphate uridylyltransferase